MKSGKCKVQNNHVSNTDHFALFTLHLSFFKQNYVTLAQAMRTSSDEPARPYPLRGRSISSAKRSSTADFKGASKGPSN
jgi:hypothetical protein